MVFHYIAVGEGLRQVWQCRQEGEAGGQPAPAGHRWEGRVHQGIYRHVQIYYVDSAPHRGLLHGLSIALS